jgi:hypothetical protein
MSMQAKLLGIFSRLRAIMKKYEDPLKPKFDFEGKYDLWSFKDVEIAGRKRKEVYFAGIIVQSKWVGFYYMPIYTDVSLKEFFPERLLGTLSGKSCFRIKELDVELEGQIDEVLEKGYLLYQQRGWI